MSITVPDDLVPWPDIEKIIVKLVRDVAKRCDPRPWVGTWIPDDYEKGIRKAPIIVVQRTTGAAEVEDQVDAPLVEIGVLAQTREDANKLNQYLRSWMLEKLPNHPDAPVRIVSVTERVGAVMPPWVNPDHRYVRATFEIAVRKPRR